MSKNIDNKDLDDILESVLEDFEEEQKTEAKTTSTTTTTNTQTDPNAETKEEKDSKDKSLTETQMDELRKMMEGLAHGEWNKTFEEIFEQMNQESGAELPNLSGPLPELDKETEEAVQKLMTEFQSNPQMQEFMEGMMEKLVSKDVLYDPIKEMRDQYPPWLEANRDKLPKEELAKYEKQLDFIHQICQTYEKEPNNTSKLVGLIQAMQETGQPPAEIMKGIAPELDSAPFLQDDKNCSIM